MHRITRKWRPPLALVLGGTLAAVLSLPILGIVYLRLWGNVLGWGEAAWLIAGLACVATLVLGFLLWRLVLRPVHALTGYARAMKEGQPAPIPTHFGTPELSTLAASVTSMGDGLRSRAAGIQAYADHVTHELKSPLTAIRGASELLQDGAKGAAAQALTETIDQAAQRMQALLDDLARHAQATSSAGAGTCLVSEAASELEADIAIEIVDDGTVPLIREDLVTILTQMAHNAAEHGAAKLTLEAAENGLIIRDNGRGISAGNRARVFDPFFTTRRDSGGTGMGLSIVRSLVQARGGTISLLNEGSGASFCIEFD
ncbi:ATP-binding protein [Tateyamaria sp.]|uniref:ATP-binding protein n=1 Tax=Tateyamaria sp. TaxID=1929288 RepID=UPI003B228C0A